MGQNFRQYILNKVTETSRQNKKNRLLRNNNFTEITALTCFRTSTKTKQKMKSTAKSLLSRR